MSTYSDIRVDPIDASVSWRVMDPETHTVAELDFLPGRYGFQLLDEPQLSSLEVVQDVTGGEEWTRVTGTPAASGQYYADINTTPIQPGLLLFNVADLGKTFVVNYSGKGSSFNVAAVQEIASQTAATEAESAVNEIIGSPSFKSDFYEGVDLLVKQSDGDTVFQVDAETAAISAGYDSTVGTDYPDTLHRGWLCRAWVNFNGTGTVAIRAAANVSSITDNGTGDYTINFATPLPDDDYAIFALPGDAASTIPATSNRTCHVYSRSTSGVRLAFAFVNPSTNGMVDEDNCSVAVFR